MAENPLLCAEIKADIAPPRMPSQDPENSFLIIERKTANASTCTARNSFIRGPRTPSGPPPSTNAGSSLNLSPIQRPDLHSSELLRPIKEPASEQPCSENSSWADQIESPTEPPRKRFRAASSDKTAGGSPPLLWDYSDEVKIQVLEDDFEFVHNFEVIRLLGEGGFGRVVQIVSRLEPVVTLALKKIPLNTEKSDTAQRENEHKKRKFVNELKIMKQLKQLCYMKFLHAVQCPGYLGFLMIMCEEGTLLQHLHCMDRDKIINYSIQLASALRQMHQKNIYHGDLKIENVLIMNSNLILSDFGLSGQLEGPNERVRVAGTKGYRAPETFGPDVVNPFAADKFSLGVCIWCLVMKRTPKEEEDLSHSLDMIADTLPDNYWWVIQNLINPCPELRPAWDSITDNLEQPAVRVFSPTQPDLS